MNVSVYPLARKRCACAILSSVACPALQYFFHVVSQRARFSKKKCYRNSNVRFYRKMQYSANTTILLYQVSNNTHQQLHVSVLDIGHHQVVWWKLISSYTRNLDSRWRYESEIWRPGVVFVDQVDCFWNPSIMQSLGIMIPCVLLCAIRIDYIRLWNYYVMYNASKYYYRRCPMTLQLLYRATSLIAYLKIIYNFTVSVHGFLYHVFIRRLPCRRCADV
jgi:hypothetical protein